MTSTRPDDEGEVRERRPLVDEQDVERVARQVGSAVGSTVGSTVASVAEQMRERAAAAEAERDALLASDADRDAAVRVLADAFSVGRLSATELEDRTGRVLGARTHGELDDLLAGLGGYPVAGPAARGRTGVVGLVAFWTSPCVFVGSRPTAGYSVEIVGTRRENGALVVQYRETAPERGMMTAQVLTSPYHLVSVPRVDGDVKFERLP